MERKRRTYTSEENSFFMNALNLYASKTEDRSGNKLKRPSVHSLQTSFHLENIKNLKTTS
jgi:hypothetical protein